MPPVSTQNSPRDVYPFRTSTNSSFNVYAPSEHYNKMNHHLPQVQTAQSVPASIANSPTPLSASSASSAFQFRDSAYRDPQSLRDPVYRDAGMRDLPLSPGTRGSVGSNSTVIGSRGSLSSLASIGTISTRTSMGSVGSHSSGDSANTLGSDSTLGMWHNNNSGEDSYFQSNLISNGGLPTAPSSASSLNGSKMPLSAVGNNLASPSSSHAALQITSIPRDITQRECHFLFALAPDFISVELNRNAVSGELSLAAKFSSLQGAHSAAQTLERRNDLFGYEVKTSVQSYAAPHPQHTQGPPRNLYSARPYLGESYWSQPPVTPLSPSTTSDLFSNSRRASLVSPTDHINNTQFGHPSLVPSSPSHPASQSYESAPSQINGAESNGNAYITSNGASPNSTGSSNALHGKVNSYVPPSNAGSPTNTSPASSTVFAAPVSQNSTGSLSPSSKTATVSSSSVSSPLSGSAPISSTSASKSSAPIGSSIHHQSHQASHGDISVNSHASNLRHASTTSQSSTGSNHVDPAKIPPPNPADQNPPCNTLYVGNLPPDTSENELKGLFSQQPGYRRLCFRTKQNGPMCFVEFEDEKLAGRALSELYGVALSNSVKGGIRLSYSKNPLGVRSRPMRSK